MFIYTRLTHTHTHTHTHTRVPQCIEFELSSSQDLECSYTEVDGGGRRKRRKASIASRSILV